MIGQTISHYKISEKLGGGGMGVVYKAEDTRLGRNVALKFLPEKYAQNKQALERFQREARAASALDHPNICAIYDIGEHEGQPFIVMQYLEGHTLRSRIVDGPLEKEELLELAIQITGALAAAHQKGIIHRDIKPDNVFVTESGQVKLLDFGLAKLAVEAPYGDQETPANLTAVGVAVGTPYYMSPEQLLEKELDARSDIFSFGVLLYEMATSTLPFTGQDIKVVFNKILNSASTSLMDLNPDLPVELGRLIQKALEKDREMRYQTASDLGVDLARLKRDTGSERTEGLARQSAEAWVQQLRIIQPWELVARDGREFAETGAGIMYWFKVPLGGICYPEGFRNFLQPALENANISKIRFLLDSSVPTSPQLWNDLVIPLLKDWAKRGSRDFRLDQQNDDGRFVVNAEPSKVLAWVFVDLSEEASSPCFKLFVDDPDSDEPAQLQAQVFLATATRNVRFNDGTLHTVRIPNAILRVNSPGGENLLYALNTVADQWDFLFS